MLDIIKGVIHRALKVVIYGPEGIGKSTLASRFPNPLFIDTEDGTSNLDVNRIAGVDSWKALLNAVYEIILNPMLCKTLIIDTADQAETWAIQYILTENSRSGHPLTSIESFGYGKGYVMLSEEFSKLLAALDDVIAVGVNVMFVAHAKMRKFEEPNEMGAYDRWEMKLTRNVAPLLKEWSDLLLFCNYQTFIVRSETNKPKAQGGKRVMYTTHNPCWDAKNRLGLPEELPMEYDSVAGLIPVIKEPREQMYELMERDNVTEDQLKAVVTARGHYGPETPVDRYPDSFITGWVLKFWDQIKNVINAEEADQNYEQEAHKDE